MRLRRDALVRNKFIKLADQTLKTRRKNNNHQGLFFINNHMSALGKKEGFFDGRKYLLAYRVTKYGILL